MNIQCAGLDLIRNPDKFYDWIGLKQSPGTASTKTTQAAKAPFVQKPKKEKDLFLEGFYSVADKPKEERRSYTSPFAKSRAILDSMSQTKPAKSVAVDEEDDFLKGFYSVADRPKEETPISAQPPVVQKNTQTTYKPGDWLRSTMAKPSPYVILSEVEESQKDKKPSPWNGKNADLSPQKVNYASQTNASATPFRNTRTGETRDEYDSRVRQQYAARRQAEEDNQRELLQSTWDDMQAGYKLGDWMRRTTTQPNKPFYQSEYSNTDIGFEYPREKHYIENVPASDIMYGSNSEKALNYISNFLTVASLIPGIDTFADLAAIPVDLMRDDYLSAGLDLVGAVPFVGEIADFAKYAKIADDVSDAAKLADNISDATKIYDNLSDSIDVLDDITDAASDFSHFPKKLHEGRHGKHLMGHNNYIPGRSIISVSDDELLDLVKKNVGKGRMVASNKEVVDFGKVIGKYVDPKTGVAYDTSFGTIHYSKAGLHVVPAKPMEWRK